MFTFIYYNSFPTSPLSVTKESTAVEKCVHSPEVGVRPLLSNHTPVPLSIFSQLLYMSYFDGHKESHEDIFSIRIIRNYEIIQLHCQGLWCFVYCVFVSLPTPLLGAWWLLAPNFFDVFHLWLLLRLSFLSSSVSWVWHQIVVHS